MKHLQLIFSISILGILTASQVQAACSWTEWRIVNSTGKQTHTCQGVVSDNSSCSGQAPQGASTISETIAYECCCVTTDTNSQKKREALFVAPDIQISIPGLAKLSTDTIKCETDSQGNRTKCQFTWIQEYISALYKYAFSIVGILATIILMVGGVIWITSAGDSGKIGQAKKMISGSIIGIALLFASTLILAVINPALVNIPALGISIVSEVDNEPASNEGNPDNSTECEDCRDIASIPIKNGKSLNSALADKLETAYGQRGALSWRVTEAYPPSSDHKSKCHYNGMCADVALTSSPVTCDDVEKLIETLQAAGLKTLNEYEQCNGTKTTYSTGGHIHVY